MALLALPLIISGCFGLRGNNANNQSNGGDSEDYSLYENQTLGEAAYQVKYPTAWKIKEISNGRFGTATDEVIFKANKGQELKVIVEKPSEENKILDSYNITTQAQTEVSRFLGTRIVGQLKADEAKGEEMVLIKNGDYLYVLKTNLPNSPEFLDFLNNINIINNLNVMVTPVESFPIYKLYFILKGKANPDCSAHHYREVYLSVPEEELVLIPNIIKALLSPSQLRLGDLGLYTAIPKETRLLSFGYDNNKAIVNFSSHLKEGNDTCAFGMRHSQIEKTLKSLNDVSNLRIKEVEIQVEGEVW